MNSKTKNRRGPDRRDVLKFGGTATAGLVTSLAAPAKVGAQNPVMWRMATPWPRNTPGVFASASRLAESITLMSGGRLQVSAHPAGEIVPPNKIFDAVSDAKVEMGHGSAHYWRERDPAFQFFTGLPFGLTAKEHAGWLYFGGGQGLWEQAYGPFGVIPFLAGNSGTQAGGWFVNEIRKPEDLHGLKFRISGMGADVMKLLGAVPVDIPPSDIFPAMRSGEMGGAEWFGPWNDLAFGFHKLARYYYLPGFHEISAALELTVNAAAFAKLEPALQEIVRRAAMAAANETLADFTYHNALSLELIETKTSAIVHAFPPAVLKAFGDASAQATEELGAANRLARTTKISYFAYLSKAVTYTRASEIPALVQRAESLK